MALRRAPDPDDLGGHPGSRVPPLDRKGEWAVMGESGLRAGFLGGVAGADGSRDSRGTCDDKWKPPSFGSLGSACDAAMASRRRCVASRLLNSSRCCCVRPNTGGACRSRLFGCSVFVSDCASARGGRAYSDARDEVSISCVRGKG